MRSYSPTRSWPPPATRAQDAGDHNQLPENCVFMAVVFASVLFLARQSSKQPSPRTGPAIPIVEIVLIIAVDATVPTIPMKSDGDGGLLRRCLDPVQEGRRPTDKAW